MPEKRNYWVTYPIAGSVSVEVEAENETEAIELGWDLTADSNAELVWESMEHIVQGNVFYGDTNEISVEEADQSSE